MRVGESLTKSGYNQRNPDHSSILKVKKLEYSESNFVYSRSIVGVELKEGCNERTAVKSLCPILLCAINTF